MTLLKVENSAGADRDEVAIAHLRRILLGRIAELELLEKLPSSEDDQPL
jgi:hypothetical protein